MREHTLKIWPGPFAAICDGFKRHEIRRDDRGYMVNDVLILREWDPAPKMAGGTRGAIGFTGRERRAVVTYKTDAGSWGLPDHLCVMTIEVLS